MVIEPGSSPVLFNTPVGSALEKNSTTFMFMAGSFMSEALNRCSGLVLSYGLGINCLYGSSFVHSLSRGIGIMPSVINRKDSLSFTSASAASIDFLSHHA